MVNFEELETISYPDEAFEKVYATKYPEVDTEFPSPEFVDEGGSQASVFKAAHGDPTCEGFIELGGDFKGVSIGISGAGVSSYEDQYHAIGGSYGTAEYNAEFDIFEIRYEESDVERLFNIILKENPDYVEEYIDFDELDEDEQIEFDDMDTIVYDYLKENAMEFSEVNEFMGEFDDRCNAYIDALDAWCDNLSETVNSINESESRWSGEDEDDEYYEE